MADLGDKNIPQPLLNSISPAPLKALFFREQCAQPENCIVEIWSLQDDSFAVFEGDYEGVWGADNVKLVGQYPTLDKAKFAASTYDLEGGTAALGDSAAQTASTRQRLRKLAKQN